MWDRIMYHMLRFFVAMRINAMCVHGSLAWTFLWQVYRIRMGSVIFKAWCHQRMSSPRYEKFYIFAPGTSCTVHICTPLSSLSRCNPKCTCFSQLGSLVVVLSAWWAHSVSWLSARGCGKGMTWPLPLHQKQSLSDGWWSVQQWNACMLNTQQSYAPHHPMFVLFTQCTLLNVYTYLLPCT